MRARHQRTHLMGLSNRDTNLFQISSKLKSQTIFERSFNKSKSLVPKLLSSSLPISTKEKIDNRTNHFQGFHQEFQTSRFDQNNIIGYKEEIIIPFQLSKNLSFESQLNHKIKNIQQQFIDKNINLTKISQLKNTFITNNKNKKNLNTYFQKFAQNGIINKNGIKQIAKQYGYDINQDQTNLILKLTHHSNHSQHYEDFLKIDSFVQLMTKDSIFYRTLQLKNTSKNNLGQITFQQNFSEKVHLILRNKFINLKQAFNIYIQRNEDIGIKEFNYVMKKLDLNDLVITKSQRQQVFNKYSNGKGKLNVEGLLCAIIHQQNNNIVGGVPKSTFIGDLKVNEQQKFAKQQKLRNFSLKNLSTLEYQVQYNKARAVIEQLTRLRTKRKQNNQDIDIYKNMFKNNIISHQQVIANTEKLLKGQGINFYKEDYEAFAAYLNYDCSTQITEARINELLFQEPEHIARDRFERRLRQEAPQFHQQLTNQLSAQVDQVRAEQALQKLKQRKMYPQSRELFRYFDIDQDGFISKNEFKQKLGHLNIINNQQIQNLSNYLKLNDNGSINFQDFAKMLKDQAEVVINDQNFRKSKDWKNATSLKKTFIQENKQSSYQQPTRHSAWPTNLYIQDLSLLQPPKNTGMYLSQAQRFTQKKQDFGKNQKLQIQAKSQNKVKKLAQWNKILQHRLEQTRQKQQQKQAAKTYKSKLAMQKYQFNCHK